MRGTIAFRNVPRKKAAMKAAFSFIPANVLRTFAGKSFRCDPRSFARKARIRALSPRKVFFATHMSRRKTI